MGDKVNLLTFNTAIFQMKRCHFLIWTNVQPALLRFILFEIRFDMLLYLTLVKSFITWIIISQMYYIWMGLFEPVSLLSIIQLCKIICQLIFRLFTDRFQTLGGQELDCPIVTTFNSELAKQFIMKQTKKVEIFPR